MHSVCSDGALTPEALIDRAFERGVSRLALTDHDTVAGVARAAARARLRGISLYTGVEWSCHWNGMNIHVLSYGFALNNSHVIDLAGQQRERRYARACMIAEKIKKAFGLSDPMSEVARFYEGDVPGRPHFAAMLVELGAVTTVQEAFAKFLGSGKPGDVKCTWLSLEELMEKLTVAGCVSCVAHPRKYNMTVAKLRRLLDQFKMLGGEAMEVSTSGQKQGELGLLADLCQRYDLYAGEGSDFHSPAYRWAEIGGHSRLPETVRPLTELVAPVSLDAG